MKTSVILHAKHNEFTLEQMRACVELATKYGGSFRHVVTGIQIYNLEKDNKAALIEELPEGIATVKHRAVNSIIACEGKEGCVNGFMNTRELEAYIDEKYYGRATAHKCKIGISGCGKNCADVTIKDIGFIGTESGYTLMIGGEAGHQPKTGMVVAQHLSVEEAKQAIDYLMDWYTIKAEPKERLGQTLARLGNPFLEHKA